MLKTVQLYVSEFYLMAFGKHTVDCGSCFDNFVSGQRYEEGHIPHHINKNRWKITSGDKFTTPNVQAN